MVVHPKGRLLLVVMLLVNGSAQSAHCEEEKNTAVFRIRIDGKEHLLRGGRTERIALPDGKEIDVSVSLNAKQPYKTPELQFEHDVELSLEDDKDTSERTITLLHASGCGLVITDQGLAEEMDQRELLEQLVVETHKRLKRGVVTNFSKKSTKEITFPHSKGLTTKSTHLDEDGDKITYHYYVLQCDNRIVSVFGFFDQDGDDVYLRIQKTLLDSLQKSK